MAGCRGAPQAAPHLCSSRGGTSEEVNVSVRMCHRYKQELSLAMEREKSLEREQVQLDLDWQRRCDNIERDQIQRSEALIQGLVEARGQVCVGAVERRPSRGVASRRRGGSTCSALLEGFGSLNSKTSPRSNERALHCQPLQCAIALLCALVWPTWQGHAGGWAWEEEVCCLALQTWPEF